MSDDPNTTNTTLVDGLRMVAIFRSDLEIPVGKLAVQAGHAFLFAWKAAYEQDPEAALKYADDHQAKIVVVAPDVAALRKIEAKAKCRGIATALITDAGRTVFKVPTITVLGLGPMSKTDCNALTRGLDML